MNLIRKIRDWFNRGMNPGQVYVMPETDSADGLPTVETAGNPDSGHRERRSFLLRQVGPNELVPESIESWDRYGNVMEGQNVDVRVISASQQVVDPSALQAICSVCGIAEDAVLRSNISQRTLCRTCARPFTLPDGGVITVSPEEYSVLWDNYDTWAEFDQRRVRGDQ